MPGADMIIVKKIFCKICFKKYGVKRKCKELDQGKEVYLVQVHKTEQKIFTEYYTITAKSKKEAEKEVLGDVQYSCKGGEPLRCTNLQEETIEFGAYADVVSEMIFFEPDELKRAIDLDEEP